MLLTTLLIFVFVGLFVVRILFAPSAFLGTLHLPTWGTWLLLLAILTWLLRDE